MTPHVLGLNNQKDRVSDNQYGDHRESGFEGEIKSSFLNMVTLRYLLDIQVEIACWQVDTSLEFRREIQNGDKCFRVANTL